uniref:Uncharacterized protein n=1 Tax=Ixodes ricinus TaxID=34613 RepID=A0A0K8R6C1_IXORI
MSQTPPAFREIQFLRRACGGRTSELTRHVRRFKPTSQQQTSFRISQASVSKGSPFLSPAQTTEWEPPPNERTSIRRPRFC